MIEKLLETTAEDRNERKSECCSQCARLESEIKEINKVAQQETNENADKIAVRNTVEGKIKAKKSLGVWIIVLGVALAAVGLALLKNNDLMILSYAGMAVGAIVAIVGIIVFMGWKQFAQEKEDADRVLADYDSKQAEHRAEIGARESEISTYKKELEIIREYEKNEEFYQWEATVKTGHVFIFATSELHMMEDTPREPKEGKAYESLSLRELEIYFNEMMYGSGKRVFKDSKHHPMFCHAEVEDEGTQKYQVRMLVQVADRTWEKISKPVPMRKTTKSEFVWYHVSLCQKNTTVYTQEYDCLLDLMEAMRVSKDDMMRLIR